MAHLAISWSRWADFAQCPRKFFLKYIEKAENFKETGEKSIHLVRGEQLHKQLENYVLHRLDPYNEATNPNGVKMPAMSPETAAAVPLIEELLGTSEIVLPETQLAIDKDWNKVEWFAKDAAIRAILDLIALRLKEKHAIIWDWKSGKYAPYADECGQLHLSAAMVILLKDLDYADVAYIFLDSKKSSSIRVTREQAIEVKKVFDGRFQQVNTEKVWSPKRNDNCTWCNARQDQCPNSRKF